MTTRPLIAIAVCAGLALGGVATAAPKKPGDKPSCNLIEDAKGDTFVARAQDGAGAYGPQESVLDIVSGDLAATGKTLTAVLRVDKLAKAASSSPGGLAFRVQFSTPQQDDENMYMSATINGGTETFTAGTRAITANLSTKLADGTGVFDLAKNEVRISVPLSTFAEQGVKPGAMVSLADLDQTSARLTPTGSSVFADVATTGKSYRIGGASCVVPGK